MNAGAPDKDGLGHGPPNAGFMKNSPNGKVRALNP